MRGSTAFQGVVAAWLRGMARNSKETASLRYGTAYRRLSCSHTYTDLGADPGGSATDVVRHCPPWSVLIRHHPPSSQSHYGGYATFLLRTRYDLMLSDGGLAADWRRTSVVWRSTAAILLPWSVCVPPKSARKCSKSAQRRSSVAKVRS